MTVFLGLGIGAGLVSALLFASVGAGALPAVLLMYLAPLPILIVALGWHHLVGLLALAIGAAATSMLVRPATGIAFALGPAFSAWLLAYLALLVRPAIAAEPVPQAASVPADPWYPVGKLLFWLGVAGAAITVSSLAAATGGDYDRYREALEQAAGSLLRREARVGRSGPLPEAFGVAGRDFIRIMVAFAPALLASMLTLILAVNLWLAGKVVAISGRLARPWPDIPAARMPLGALPAMLAGGVLSLLPGFAGAVGTAIAGGLLMAFALQGLALVHFVSRNRAGRGAVLSLLYVMTVILAYVFLPAFALLGLADTALPIRRALGGFRPPPPSPGPRP